MPDRACLFVSGMGRSGTTLLDKLLSNHRRLCVLSQPFPYLYVQAKRDFLRTLGDTDSHQPLSHYFLDNRYGPTDLLRFLETYRVTGEAVRQLFDEMADYDGQYHKPVDLAGRLADVSGGSFLETYRQLVWALRYSDSADWYGAKETHCEEFFPFFVRHGVKCLAIVRDPRDVITSFHYGQGHQYGGRRRPTLFYVRNWRKSLMFVRLLEAHENFLWLRYEELVTQPDVQLKRIADFLGIECSSSSSSSSSEFRQEGLLQQDGRPWQGNSSYEPSNVMNERSVGRYREWLPEPMRRYIEVCCLPELRLLNYDVSVELADAERVLAEYREPFPIERADFPPDYSSDELHLRQEARRLRLLHEAEQVDSEGYFPTAGIRAELARALAGDPLLAGDAGSGSSSCRSDRLTN